MNMMSLFSVISGSGCSGENCYIRWGQPVWRVTVVTPYDVGSGYPGECSPHLASSHKVRHVTQKWSNKSSPEEAGFMQQVACW